MTARLGSVTLAIVIAFLQIPVATPSADQPDVAFTVLYSFKGGTDGAAPAGKLLREASGNLYGTTFSGGASGKGTVFKLDATGVETVLYSFAGGADGSGPLGGLIQDAAGNFYGTTYSGGGMPTCDCGTVFKLDMTGAETVLHRFTVEEGAGPQAGLIRDATGNLYGTTYYGGAFDNGTVFKLDSTGAVTVLHTFTGRSDGGGPHGGLLRDAAGNLYGTTPYGGFHGGGTVFKLDTTGGETVLHKFLDDPDGKAPWAGLVGDAAGTLYGTTVAGGTDGIGTVFKLDKAGRGGVLHSFSGPDGAQPMGELILDPAGNLYGTTNAQGSSNAGTVFKLDTAGNLTLLHDFRGIRNGMKPQAGLVRDPAGNLYGTTPNGGAFNQGTVFKITR